MNRFARGCDIDLQEVLQRQHLVRGRPATSPFSGSPVQDHIGESVRVALSGNARQGVHREVGGSKIRSAGGDEQEHVVESLTPSEQPPCRRAHDVHHRRVDDENLVPITGVDGIQSAHVDDLDIHGLLPQTVAHSGNQSVLELAALGGHEDPGRLVG
jgi:hypothetical protein